MGQLCLEQLTGNYSKLSKKAGAHCDWLKVPILRKKDRKFSLRLLKRSFKCKRSFRLQRKHSLRKHKKLRQLIRNQSQFFAD